MNILKQGAELKKIEKLRADIAATQAEIAAAEVIPVPPDVARARLVDALNADLAQWSPRTSLVSFFAADVRDVDLQRKGMTLADMAWLFGADRVADLVMERLAGATGGTKPLHPDDRAAKLRALGQKLDELEIAEETAICELIEAERIVLRRADVRPDILFRVWNARSENTEATA